MYTWTVHLPGRCLVQFIRPQQVYVKVAFDLYRVLYIFRCNVWDKATLCRCTGLKTRKLLFTRLILNFFTALYANIVLENIFYLLFSLHICSTLWINFFSAARWVFILAVIHSAPEQSKETLCAKDLSLATLNLRRGKKWRLVFHSSYVHVRLCGGRANRGVAVRGPHASLHPCRMCRWRAASPRIGAESQAGLYSRKWQLRGLKEDFYFIYKHTLLLLIKLLQKSLQSGHVLRI